jgi:predicted extracellular nuclease
MKSLRRTLFTLGTMLLFLAVTVSPSLAAGPTVFINEIHYDNAGTDTGEGFEIAGPAGTNLAGWSVVLYNGNGGAVYNTIALSGTIPNQQAGFGTLSFLQAGIQNGSPDGMALVDAGSVVVEFLSYEGSFVAVGGPANGMASIDIGVSEGSGTPVGDSLQLTGTGTMGGDFTWAAAQPSTFGAVNTGQTFGIVTGPTDPVINEFVANHTGADSQAFLEVFGDPSTDYSAFTVLEIEGDSSGAGVIDAVLPMGTTNAGGYWIDDEDMENGTITILLVENFSGTQGNDLDTNNDGTFDSAPWTRIVDDVATTDGGGSDHAYSATVLAAFFDGNPFGAGGASRIPNGTDTDTTGDWVRNDFHGFGFPGFPGSPALGEAENTPGAVNAPITVPTDPLGVCNDPATLIHDIQGSGLASPDIGSIREIEGIVTGDFEGSSELSGFFMQEESADFDGDGTTSEGIFVFNGGVGSVNTGDTVRVRGTVAEFFSLTEINNVVSVTGCQATGTTAAASWSLPVTSVSDWEWVEGMEVTINQTLHASGNFTQARFGEVDLSVGGPLDNPTNVVAPGAPAIALQDLNDRSRIQLDDGSTVQNPLPLPPYIGPGSTLRTGDTLSNLTGVVSFAFGNYEMHPTQTVNFTRANVRPGVPSVGGTLQVAAYNVLNYFTTIDNAGPICGPLGNQGCRGADTASEFTRQRDKIITAISTLDVDVVGLMEIENAPGNTPEADLVAGLNAATSPGTYEYIAAGAIGGDAIRVALLYKPASVTPLGNFEILDSSDDPRFDDTLNRPMLTQSFVENATGAVFTVGVNHLKSKGSNCNVVGDPDTGDGQGNCNITRTNAARAIVDWLATDPTGSGDSDYLVIGDLNAYAQEDPVVTIEAGGYTDLIEFFEGTGFGSGAYSFNFFSQSGYLDHGMSSETMTPQVTGAAFWHVNADEPSGLDYNNFNQPLLYNPDQFRSSDHDPVVIGLGLIPAKELKETAVTELTLLLPTGDKQDDKFIQKAIDLIDESFNPDWWVDSATLEPKDGNHVFDREHQAVQELQKVETVDVQSAIDQLVDADRQLALVQLIAAIDAGGDPDRIQAAFDRMSDAAANVANGDFAKAVLDYKKAWQEAVKAQ